MNDMILEILRGGRHDTSAYIRNVLRHTYPKLTTKMVTERLFRLEKKGLVKRLNPNIHGGMQYLWTVV